MSVDSKELRRLAGAAMPYSGKFNLKAHVIEVAEFIAAANPQAILALLDELDALREVVRAADSMRLWNGPDIDTPVPIAHYDAARAKVKLPRWRLAA